MTGRPATYAKEEIIEAIEKLRQDPGKEVNVNQIRALLNGGNRDRIRRVLEEHQNAKATEVAQADAKSHMAQFGQLDQEVREQAGETLVAQMQGVVALLAKAVEAEQAKAQRELDATKEAYELLLRERDTELARVKDGHAELCTVLDDMNDQLDASYASAAQLMAQRDATAKERDRLAAEANRLAEENARLAAELGKRKSRVRKPRAAAAVVAGEKPGPTNTAQPETGSDRVLVERPTAPGASDGGPRVLQNTMFSLAAETSGDGNKSEKLQSKPMDGGDAGQADARNTQARAAGDRESKPSAASRAGAPPLRAVGGVSPGPAGAHGAGGAGG
jgi:hypothetical protein